MPQPRSPGSRAFSKTAAERNVLLQAYRDARDDTLRYIEEEIAFTTLGKGGKGGFERARMAWVTIDHFTSRPKVTVKRVDPETGAMGTELHTLNPRMPGDPQIIPTTSCRTSSSPNPGVWRQFRIVSWRGASTSSAGSIKPGSSAASGTPASRRSFAQRRRWPSYPAYRTRSARSFRSVRGTLTKPPGPRRPSAVWTGTRWTRTRT